MTGGNAIPVALPPAGNVLEYVACSCACVCGAAQSRQGQREKEKVHRFLMRLNPEFTTRNSGGWDSQYKAGSSKESRGSYGKIQHGSYGKKSAGSFNQANAVQVVNQSFPTLPSLKDGFNVYSVWSNLMKRENIRQDRVLKKMIGVDELHGGIYYLRYIARAREVYKVAVVRENDLRHKRLRHPSPRVSIPDLLFKKYVNKDCEEEEENVDQENGEAHTLVHDVNIGDSGESSIIPNDSPIDHGFPGHASPSRTPSRIRGDNLPKESGPRSPTRPIHAHNSLTQISPPLGFTEEPGISPTTSSDSAPKDIPSLRRSDRVRRPPSFLKDHMLNPVHIERLLAIRGGKLLWQKNCRHLNLTVLRL
ncbi:hypothetical protein CRG98_022681 [Punica granatum]|uniref:Uncharacterized protein n=1 Tax=Punica granatum TaxID=22663 RepID=A0A2I0JN44_PUNGR|nr:hypothetical protein CRG98_022681 [Punica granatum]